jgi:hypothetical protein
MMLKVGGALLPSPKGFVQAGPYGIVFTFHGASLRVEANSQVMQFCGATAYQA